MPKLWVLLGIKKGIITTKYPKTEPTREELPAMCMPPTPTDESEWQKGMELCPTGAIVPPTDRLAGRVELGKCVYCRRCADAGFKFSDAVGT